MASTSNQYYSDAKARLALSVTGTGLTYNNTTGVFTSGPGAITWTAVGSGGSTFGANVSAGVPAPQFGIENEVLLRGVAALAGAKNAGDTIMSLPAAAFPAATRYAELFAIDGSSNAKVCYVQISAAGVITVLNGGLASGDTLYLDLLHYTLL